MVSWLPAGSPMVYSGVWSAFGLTVAISSRTAYSTARMAVIILVALATCRFSSMFFPYTTCPLAESIRQTYLEVVAGAAARAGDRFKTA